MTYLYFKAVHIVFVITWFAGMFYLVRLLIYDREACDKVAIERSILQKQFTIMIGRLYWAITLPSAVITLVMGVSLVWSYPTWPMWLKIKLCFVGLLYGYQVSLHYLVKQHKSGIYKLSSQQLRLWNEVPTILLVAVVMLVVVKSNMSWVYGLVGLIALILVISFAIRLYRYLRNDYRSDKSL
jgi:putative membrane protein